MLEAKIENLQQQIDNVLTCEDAVSLQLVVRLVVQQFHHKSK